jgi:branched-chain amino acid aminotransferase
MPPVYPTILDTVCSTPEELLNSSDFQRVLHLFNRYQQRKNPLWKPLTIQDVQQNPRQAEMLLTFWEHKISPKMHGEKREGRSLDNREYAALVDVVERSFLRIITATAGEVLFSVQHLDVIRRGARELLNNGYVPVIVYNGGNPYGEPIYPIDVEGKNTQHYPSDAVIKVIPMPQVRHNGERIEFTNFVNPEDPEKMRAIAERGELGFTQKERDTSHISFATCLAKKGPTTQEWTSIQWSQNVTVPNARFASHPLEQMRQYGSGLFEGIGVERGVDGKVFIFRLRDHWIRMSLGGQYFRLPPIPFEVFEQMVIATVQANWDYIPPQGKGRLYIRPNWFDIGPKMHVGTSGEYVLMMTAVPIGASQSYYKKSTSSVEGETREDKGMTIFFPYNVYRSTENGPGQTKADGNYGATVPHIEAAEKEGMMGVMYMNEKGDAVAETNASSLIFLQILPGQQTQDGKQKYRLLTPSLQRGTVLNSITRQTILTLATEELDWEVVEEDISPDRLAKMIREKKIVAAFSAGTGAVLTPIHNIQRGTIMMRDEKNDKGEWIRTFDIVKKPDGTIDGERMIIGNYDPDNPYTDAGKDLLQILLSAKSGALQRKAEEDFLKSKIQDPVVLEKLYMRRNTYRDWLTVVSPPEGKK